MQDDFLRIILSEEQLNENKDRALAQNMQYNMNLQEHQMQQQYQLQQQHDLNQIPPNYIPYHMGQFRMRDPESDSSRGRFEVNIVEAKLNKNYGFTKMDPYVRVKLGNKIFETPTDYNGSKNPVWKKNILWYEN